MGGGPSQWAARDHVVAGGALYATPSAARTFNDDLDYVQREMGVRLVSDDEARALPGLVPADRLTDETGNERTGDAEHRSHDQALSRGAVRGFAVS